ncbi:hypothetical protein Ahy_A09g045102 isoform A [Arachis hypogaea]|uniref:Transposase MuDR plant domain-containing protein n=1 Tax=Arachis hypogaea TaxID=3818 RepID=A0A445BLK3_ARAHY|nr:hypothetical protein Ahy_A09g045102 isoform A [Arachis hypogaea]
MKTKIVPKPTQTKVNKRNCLRTATGIGCTKSQKKAQGSKILVILLSSNEDSSNSDESSEDEPYKPVRKDSSSDSCKTTNKSDGRGKGKSKEKENICVDNDAFVEDVSDFEIDLGFVRGGRFENCDAYDLGTDSNGTNFWLLLKIMTPPNSEDELEEEAESDEGARGWNEKEAVREYTIQEGRRIRFKKNDRKSLKAICKVKECSWIILASKGHEDTCWQVKTFKDDHTCAREDKHKTANRNWVASKLVRKVKKYPNFKYCNANTFFKTKYDLSLNRNSISSELSNTRNVIYSDEKAKYALESKHWKPIWAGDTGYEKFECMDILRTIYLVIISTIAGILCVYACAAIARVNKHPKNFYHKLLTMESYKLQTKRRNDADEGGQSNKKSKATTTLKRQLRPFTCKYCLQKGHTKRGCQKKRDANVAKTATGSKAAEAVAKDPKNAAQNITAIASANATATRTTMTHTATATTTATATAFSTTTETVIAFATAATANPIPLVEVDGQQAKIDLSQPSYSKVEDSQKNHPLKKKTPTRLVKLPLRRRSPLPMGSAELVKPLQHGWKASSSLCPP